MDLLNKTAIKPNEILAWRRKRSRALEAMSNNNNNYYYYYYKNEDETEEDKMPSRTRRRLVESTVEQEQQQPGQMSSISSGGAIEPILARLETRCKEYDWQAPSSNANGNKKVTCTRSLSSSSSSSFSSSSSSSSSTMYKYVGDKRHSCATCNYWSCQSRQELKLAAALESSCTSADCLVVTNETSDNFDKIKMKMKTKMKRKKIKRSKKKNIVWLARSRWFNEQFGTTLLSLPIVTIILLTLIEQTPIVAAAGHTELARHSLAQKQAAATSSSSTSSLQAQQVNNEDAPLIWPADKGQQQPATSEQEAANLPAPTPYDAVVEDGGMGSGVDVLSKRSSVVQSLDQMSSAELPAEFRGGGGGDDDDYAKDEPTPREQSRLAKLCQQTSSVLASVLPAPFGGHKRSILCQFFGQVHVNAGTKPEPKPNGSGNRAPPHYPIGGMSPLALSLQQPTTNLIGGSSANSQQAGELESIAILHQHQQPPVALFATGKHPIQLVLEHQQRQASVAARGIDLKRAPVINAQPNHHHHQPHQSHYKRPQLVVPLNQFQDLSAAAISRLHSDDKQPVQKRQDGQAARQAPMKFSAPLVVASQAEQAALMSSLAPSSTTTSSGWRIFNTTLLGSSSSSSSLVDENRQQQQQHEADNTSRPSSPMPPLAQSSSKPLKSATLERDQIVGQSGSNPPMKKSNEVTVVSSGTEEALQNNNSTRVDSVAQPQPTIKQTRSYQRPKTIVVGGGGGGVNGGGEPTVARQLQIGKRTSETPLSYNATTTTKQPDKFQGEQQQQQQQQQQPLHKDLQVTESRQASVEITAGGQDGMRTIEVMAQSASAPEQSMANNTAQSQAIVVAIDPVKPLPLSSSSQPQQQQSDLHTSQKREELVIASINNLTRIAFGNQLRDTVKVINKLIDQQADLFGSSGGKHLSANSAGQPATAFQGTDRSSQLDSMLASESIGHSQVAHSLLPNQLLEPLHEAVGKKTHPTRSQSLSLVKSRKDAQKVSSSDKFINNDTNVKVKTIGFKGMTSAAGGSDSKQAIRSKLNSSTTGARTSTTVAAIGADSGAKRQTEKASQKKGKKHRGLESEKVIASSGPAGSRKFDLTIKEANKSTAKSSPTVHQEVAEQATRGAKFSQFMPTPPPPSSNVQSTIELNNKSQALPTVNRKHNHAGSLGAPAFELKRLTTGSRHLSSTSNDQSMNRFAAKVKALGYQQQQQSSALGLDLERTQLSTVASDFSKSLSSSNWTPSSGPIRLSNRVDKSYPTTTKATKPLVDTLLDQQSSVSNTNNLSTRASPAVSGITSAPPAGVAASTTTSNFVTQFPWLVPDKSALNTDLFSHVGPSETRQTSAIFDALASSLPPLPSTSESKSPTSRRMVTSYMKGFQLTPTGGLKQQQQHLLNRVESKQDSLTTLKMALSRTTSSSLSSSTTTTTTAAAAASSPQQPLATTTTTLGSTTTSAPQLIAVKSTRLPFSSGIQSRWIPSTMLVTRPPTSTTSTTSRSTTTSATTSTRAAPTTIAPAASPHSTTTMQPSLISSTTDITASNSAKSAPDTTSTKSLAASSPASDQREKIRDQETTAAAAPVNSQEYKQQASTLSDLNESRASDTISKYTSHLNGEANELIATTRRHFQGPLPQIANTGDYFSAETIASWPDKYHTMVSQTSTVAVPDNQHKHQHYLEQQQQQPGSSRTTASAFGAETTRRNGEEYDLSGSASSLAYSSLGPFEVSDNPQTSTTRDHARSIAQSKLLARHRIDTDTPLDSGAQATTTRLQTLGYIMTNTPGITILPSNHKLTPPKALDNSNDDNDQRQQQQHHQDQSPSTAVTSPMDTTASTEQPLSNAAASSYLPATTQAKPQVPPYTIIDQLITNAPPAGNLSEVNEIGALTSPSAAAAAAAINDTDLTPISGSVDNKLRAPYQGTYAFNDNGQDFNELKLMSDPTLILDSNSSRPNVSRKLYELLVPSSQNFAGLQHSLNAQRFNWSALKYLAQSLLASAPLIGATKRYNESMSLKAIGDDSAWDAANNLQQYANLNLNNNETEINNNNNSSNNINNNNNNYNSSNSNYQFGATQQRLFDLMARSGLPTNYYELFATNNSVGGGDSMQQQQQQQQQQHLDINSPASNANQSQVAPLNFSGKGIFERAGNLLQEMKHLEQKKAAALLAAFRYQVPGPLVRPWDVSSDFHHQFGLHPPSSISRFFSDRQDGYTNKQLPTSQLINTIKSTLFKQKFIARDELLARLNANKDSVS